MAANARCAWANGSDAMAEYHDLEWGKPSHDDRYLFELLILEGAQAGLSWSTVLAKRENYRAALDGFDPIMISRYTEAKLAQLLENTGIVRNRLKVRGLVTNANAFMAVQKDHGSFASYLWNWVDGKPLKNRPTRTSPLPAQTELSDRISKDLKKRGFTFVGGTICYAYLEAVGVVDDHVVGCPAKLR
jgi:DNA-3-methyladenine glycosylase I